VDAATRASARPPSADVIYTALARAADEFVVSIPREGDDPALAVISQYPWFAPSLRGALIGFPGLFCVTRRLDQARALLLSLAGRLQGGLLPSELPEDGSAAVYHGADVSL